MAFAHNNTVSIATSADGTKIGFRSLGKGPGLVMVHGNAASSEDFLGVAELLQDRFTLHLMDRRGRGLSDPQGADYSLVKEGEDIVAVLTVTESSCLFGHSFGAIAAIETARSRPLEALFLYEPPIYAQGPLTALMPAFREAMKLEDYVGAYLALAGGLEVMPDTVKFRWYLENVLRPNQATWSRVIDLMKATELEARAVMAYDFAREPLLADRVLLIIGGLSPKFIQDSCEKFLEVYPTTGVITLEGQGHTAHATAPELLAETIRNYLDPLE